MAAPIPAHSAEGKNFICNGFQPFTSCHLAHIFAFEKSEHKKYKMKHILTPLFFLAFIAAQHLAAAEVIAKHSKLKNPYFRAMRLELQTSEVVPVRLRYMDEPMRVVLEFEGLNFDELPFDFGNKVRGVEMVNFGEYQGASRMVLTLKEPFLADELDFSSKAVAGGSGLKLTFKSASDDEFDDMVEKLGYLGEDLRREVVDVERMDDSKPLVVIDPGHGGVDPGAVRGGVSEKEITLAASKILKMRIEESGRYEVVLTRDSDQFISLLSRRQFAERLGADILLSIHADTVEIGDAMGTTVYQLSDKATSQIAAHFAEFENRADLFSGEYEEVKQNDLSAVLTDLAHQSSREKASLLARIIQKNLIEVNRKPSDSRLESAAFAVLKAPEIPSLLIEIGYMSNAEDARKIQNQSWLNNLSQQILRSLDDYFQNGEP